MRVAFHALSFLYLVEETMPKRETISPDDALLAEMLGHHDELARVAQWFLTGKHLAEDAVGTSYLRAWGSRSQL